MDNGASSYLRFLDGDDNAFVSIIRDYKDGLILYLDSFTHNIYIAEDLMEDTFVKIATKKPAFYRGSYLLFTASVILYGYGWISGAFNGHGIASMDNVPLVLTIVSLVCLLLAITVLIIVQAIKQTKADK